MYDWTAAKRSFSLAKSDFLVEGFCLITPGRLIHVDDNIKDSHTDSVWIDPGGYRPGASAVELANSNTLLAELDRRRVIGFDGSGAIIWQNTILNDPWDADAERLDNGNTLITQVGNGCAIEVDSSSMIVWQKTGLSLPADVNRLDGNESV